MGRGARRAPRGRVVRCPRRLRVDDMGLQRRRRAPESLSGGRPCCTRCRRRPATTSRWSCSRHRPATARRPSSGSGRRRTAVTLRPGAPAGRVRRAAARSCALSGRRRSSSGAGPRSGVASSSSWTRPPRLSRSSHWRRSTATRRRCPPGCQLVVSRRERARSDRTPPLGRARLPPAGTGAAGVHAGRVRRRCCAGWGSRTRREGRAGRGGWRLAGGDHAGRPVEARAVRSGDLGPHRRRRAGGGVRPARGAAAPTGPGGPLPRAELRARRAVPGRCATGCSRHGVRGPAGRAGGPQPLPGARRRAGDRVGTATTRGSPAPSGPSFGAVTRTRSASCDGGPSPGRPGTGGGGRPSRTPSPQVRR